MKYFKITVGIFLVLAASRFIPHPPNFTSLIALSFYVPLLFGLNFIPAVMICFIVTDIIIGFHFTTFFTWGSVLIIGLLSSYFKEKLSKRVFGSLIGAVVFFIISNFGVWILGGYEKNLNGLILCYTMAIPFFKYTFFSTLIYSIIIEFILRYFKNKSKKVNFIKIY
tara:strand:+ start:10 stop:510 length:501 start_codon:yes stop_codon:yes gene_type:complete